jgi:hypothetical protein
MMMMLFRMIPYRPTTLVQDPHQQKKCGRNFQLITAALCLVAAVIPVFCSLHLRVASLSGVSLNCNHHCKRHRLRRPWYPVSSSSSIITHGRDGPGIHTSLVHDVSIISSISISIPNVYSNNYFLISESRRVFGLVAVAMLRSITEAKQRICGSPKFQEAYPPGNGADEDLVKTATATTNNATSSNNEITRMTTRANRSARHNCTAASHDGTHITVVGSS